MHNSRVQKAGKNILWLSVYEIVTFISGLILPKLILENFGSSYNGITSSITQLLRIVSVLRLGVAGATRVALYKPLAENDVDRISSIVRATEVYLRRVGVVIIGYIVLLAVLYPRMVDTGFDTIDISVLIIALGIGVFAQYFFGITYQTLLSADQRIYVYNIIQIMSTIANTIISVILIRMNYSIQMVKLGSAIAFFLSPLILSIYVSRKYKLKKRIKPDNNSLAQKKDVMGHSIANIVHENTDVVVLTIFCDIKLVSVYMVYNFVISGVNAILNVFTSGTEAIFGNMWAKNEKEGIRKYLGFYEYIIGVFVSVCFSATYALVLPFVSLYTSGVTDVQYIRPVYAIIVILAQIFYCFRIPYRTLVQGAGHYKQTKNGAYIEATINIVISVALVNIIGLSGVAIGTLVANIFRTMQFAFYIERNIVNRGMLAVFKIMLWSLINVAISLVVGLKLSSVFAYTSWINWIYCAIAIMVVSLIVCFVSSLIFYKNNVTELCELLKKVLKISRVKRGL